MRNNPISDEVEEKMYTLIEEVILKDFSPQYKKIKVKAMSLQELTHLDQARCFASKTSSVQQSELCARNSMFAFLQLRRLNSELINPCIEQFNVKKVECERYRNEGEDGRLMCYIGSVGNGECLDRGFQDLRECLEGKRAVMERYYNDHILQFGAINRSHSNQNENLQFMFDFL